VTITKPISIVADGVEAVINTSTGAAAGITINTAAATLVTLRGLTIDMHGNGGAGIAFNAGGALHVQNTVIRKCNNGIYFGPISSGTRELTVADSVVADSGGDGIFITLAGAVVSGGAAVTAVFDRVRVENSGSNGILIDGAGLAVTATVRDSVSIGNVGNGIHASGGNGTNVTVDRTVSMSNSTGIFANGTGTTIRIGNSTVSGNTTGLSTNLSGVIDSYGTNKVNGNGTDGAPTNTIAAN
jgi:hypothetical protein